jgi:4-hydroxybenzoate polyprenyltransferase
VAPGYGRRLAGYLRDMFPLPLYGALAVFVYSDLAWLTDRQLPHSRATVSEAAVATLSILLLTLLMRLCDELKDKDLDAQHYPHRPLPAGRVSEADVRLTRVLVALAILGVAAISPGTLGAAIALLAYAAALSRHLLLRRLLERSPLLTLLTHGPFVPAMLLYALALMLAVRRLPSAALAPLPVIAMTGMLWSLITSAEIARKIRTPGEESGYPTYSQAWGLPVAVLSALAAATVALATAASLIARFANAPLMALPCLGGYLWFAAECGRLLRRPDRRHARFGVAARIYVLLVLGAFAADRWIAP